MKIGTSSLVSKSKLTTLVPNPSFFIDSRERRKSCKVVSDRNKGREYSSFTWKKNKVEVMRKFMGW